MVQECITALRLRTLLVRKTGTVILVELSRAAAYWIQVSLKVCGVGMSLLITYTYTVLYQTRGSSKQVCLYVVFINLCTCVHVCRLPGTTITRRSHYNLRCPPTSWLAHSTLYMVWPQHGTSVTWLAWTELSSSPVNVVSQSILRFCLLE